jgi:hypothetical protein
MQQQTIAFLGRVSLVFHQLKAKFYKDIPFALCTFSSSVVVHVQKKHMQHQKYPNWAGFAWYST